MLSSLDPRHLLIAAGVALAIAAAVAFHVLTRNKACRMVRGRSPLGAAEFSALFATEAEAALAPIIRDCLRAYIPVDTALVRPDDKLCDELQLAIVDGLDANAFVAEVEKAVGMKIPGPAAQGLFTLRDMVSYVAARKQ